MQRLLVCLSNPPRRSSSTYQISGQCRRGRGCTWVKFASFTFSISHPPRLQCEDMERTRWQYIAAFYRICKALCIPYLQSGKSFSQRKRWEGEKQPYSHFNRQCDLGFVFETPDRRLVSRLINDKKAMIGKTKVPYWDCSGNFNETRFVKLVILSHCNLIAL